MKSTSDSIDEVYDILEELYSEVESRSSIHLIQDAKLILDKLEFQQGKDLSDVVDIILAAFDSAGIDTRNPSLKHELTSVFNGISTDHFRLAMLLEK